MSDRPQLELCAALSLLYQSHDYADLVIIDREGARHTAHKAIVCPRSGYFAEVAKAGRWKNNIDGEVALPNEDPDLIKYMIQYLYLLDYNPPPLHSRQASSVTSRDHDCDSASTRTDPIQYGQVYGASAISAFGGPRESFSAPSPYLIPFGHGRDRSESQLTVHAIPGVADFNALSHSSDRRRRTSGRSNSNPPEPSPLASQEPQLVLHARVYAAAERYDISGLKALALDKFKIQLTRHWDSTEFAEAIHVVYTSTPNSDKSMRESIADTIGWHGGLLNKAEVEVAIMDINGLAYELLKRSRRAEPEYSD